VVQLGAKVVNSNRVDAENLQEGRIPSAGSRVRQRILALFRLVSGLSTRLVVDTDDLEALAIFVDEVPALDFKRFEGRGKGNRQKSEGSSELQIPMLAIRHVKSWI